MEGKGETNFSKLPERKNVFLSREREPDQQEPAAIEARRQWEVERLLRGGVSRNLICHFTH